MFTLRADVVAKAMLGWVLGICIILATIANNSNGPKSPFFNVGPNKDLQLFHVPIDTTERYLCVILYTMMSTCFRTLQQEVLMPWIIQNVQNEEEKTPYARHYAHFIVITNVTYVWLDWLMYLNILLAQVDLLLIEVLGNVCVTVYTTRWYMRGVSV